MPEVVNKHLSIAYLLILLNIQRWRLKIIFLKGSSEVPLTSFLKQIFQIFSFFFQKMIKQISI